jgi:LPS sulfotransferase NodH
MKIFNCKSVSVAETPPVIITGMHRSGTSLLCRLLEQSGLFVGLEKDFHNEARFFSRANIWLLEQAGARWDVPEPFEWLLQSDRFVDALVTKLRAAVRDQSRWSPMVRSFGRLRSFQSPWGWKDPRNTLTLPLWLRVFPDARILDIRRHGVDVAASLVSRSAEKLGTECERLRIGVQAHQGQSVRCLELHRALHLWAHYLELSSAWAALEPTRVLRITFEDLVTDPQSVLGAAAAHCGLEEMRGLNRMQAESVMSQRALAFRAEPQLVSFAQANATLLGKYGYAA